MPQMDEVMHAPNICARKREADRCREKDVAMLWKWHHSHDRATFGKPLVFALPNGDCRYPPGRCRTLLEWCKEKKKNKLVKIT